MDQPPRRVVKPREFKPTKLLTDKTAEVGFNAVIFGPPGVGKTTLAMSLQGTPLGGTVRLYDFYHGRESVLDVEGAHVYTPTSWRDVREDLDVALALKGDSPFRTHVFDPISGLWGLCFENISQANPGVREPRKLFYETQKLIFQFVDDSLTLAGYGINTIFIGHDQEDKEEDEPTRIVLDLSPKARQGVLTRVNHVGYLEQSRNGDRVLHLTPPKHSIQGLKLRQTKSGEQVPLKITNPDLGVFLEDLRKGRE